MLGAPIETITGRLGVGAIALLALFLSADGMQIGVFHIVESYGGSVTFGLVAALPTAVVTYVLGVFCVGTADLLLTRFEAFRDPGPEEILELSKDGGDLLKQQYLESLRNSDLLKGSSISFLLLAVGTVLDAPNMRGYESIVVVATVAAVGLSGMSLVFACRAVARAKEIANVLVSSTKP